MILDDHNGHKGQTQNDFKVEFSALAEINTEQENDTWRKTVTHICLTKKKFCGIHFMEKIWQWTKKLEIDKIT